MVGNLKFIIFALFHFKHEAQLVEDGMALSGFNVSSRYGSSEDDYADSDDTAACRTYHRNAVPVQVPPTLTLRAPDARPAVIPPFRIKREQFNKRVGVNSKPVQNGWINDKKRVIDAFANHDMNCMLVIMVLHNLICTGVASDRYCTRL
jgi:hypothetical protein